MIIHLQTYVSSGQLFIDNFYNTDYRIGELQGNPPSESQH